MPKFLGNVGLNGEFNGIGASVLCTFRVGGQIYNKTLVDKVENVDLHQNVDVRVFDGRWTEPGDHVKYKRLSQFYDSEAGEWKSYNTRPTTRFVQDLDEFNIGSVSMYYDFKKDWIKPFGLEKLKISVNANNIATFSSVKVERGTQYPFARRYSFTLRATF